jgi:tetratricopeptide (TPR) repeat protein
MVNKFRASLLAAVCLSIASSVPAQTPTAPTGKPTAPGLIKLTGGDARRAADLDNAIESAVKADRWDEAIAKAEQLVALRTRVQGPKHFETVNAEWLLKALRRVAPMPKVHRVACVSAIAMYEQATNLANQGKYSQVQALAEKALEIHRRLLTDDHPVTASSTNNLAFSLSAQGKYAQAQPLFERALEVQRRLLSEDHPDTAASYNNLAYNLTAQGKYTQAQPLYEKALAIRRRLVTDNHPDTAVSYNNLAHNLNAQGKYADAQLLFEKALEIERRLLTDDHPDTATSYANIAMNLNAQGRYAEAQPLCEKALALRRRLLTDNHPDTALSYSNLGYNLDDQRKYAQAQPLFQKALAIRRRLLTENHPETAGSYSSLAMNLNAQGRYAQAQPLLEKALALRRQLLTDNHPDTAMSYSNLAVNLGNQRKYALAQPLLEKSLEIDGRLLTDDHPHTAASYANLAYNLSAQGKYAQAQPLYEKALVICRRLLTENHHSTAISYNNLAYNLYYQGKYSDAKNRWMSAVEILDSARLLVAFTGLERAGDRKTIRPALAAVLARLGQPSEAWQALEDDLGRGLLDELTARQDRRLTAADRARLRDLTNEVEKLDKLVESTPKELGSDQRAQRFEELRRQRDLASIALGELHTELVRTYGALAGRVAKLNEIQAALPNDAALVAWVDIPLAGPNAADPDGEHSGVVVRKRGIPACVAIAGTGNDGLWTEDDVRLANQVRTALRAQPGGAAKELGPLVVKLRAQRLAPLAKALGTTSNGQPAARRLIVLPSRFTAGIPIEALLAPDDQRTVSYAPSGTVLKYLREQPRPHSHAGLLALGDPVYEHSGKADERKPTPKNGLLLNVVFRGSNAAHHGLKDGDVLLAYNGVPMNKKDDLKVITNGDKPIPIEVWRDGVTSRKDVAPGKLGVTIDSRPAPEAIVEQRKFERVLAAARSGGDDFAPLPATRREVEAVSKLFKSDNRPTRALLGTDASESELDHLAAANELKQFAFIHLATHGVINEAIPQLSAVILTQSGLPDPLDQVLNQKPVFDGRLLVREIQRTWDLKAELVTLSACNTALGREAGGEGFVGFTQALLMSGARSVCLSLWKVDDTATALLMTRFYQNLLGKRDGLSNPMPKAEGLREAKMWLRGLTRESADAATLELNHFSRSGLHREAGRYIGDHPYEHPHFWAAFVLVGDPD